MAAIHSRWLESARRPALRGPAMAIALAAGLGVAAWMSGLPFPFPVTDGGARTVPLMNEAQLAQEQHCVQGAQLVHDVRWAAACTVAAEQGQGDGMADCDLPNDRAAALHALLREAERSCAVEARAGGR